MLLLQRIQVQLTPICSSSLEAAAAAPHCPRAGRPASRGGEARRPRGLAGAGAGGTEKAGRTCAAVSRCGRGRRDGCRRLAREAESGRRGRGEIAEVEAEAAAGWGRRGTRRPRRGRGDRGVEGGRLGAGGAAKRMERAAGLGRRGSRRAGRALGASAVWAAGATAGPGVGQRRRRKAWGLVASAHGLARSLGGAERVALCNR